MDAFHEPISMFEHDDQIFPSGQSAFSYQPKFFKATANMRGDQIISKTLTGD